MFDNMDDNRDNDWKQNNNDNDCGSNTSINNVFPTKPNYSIIW